MGKKRFAKDPLLYIHQPTIRTPKAPMQDNFMTPKKSRPSAGASPSPDPSPSAGAPEEKPSQKPKARTVKRDSYFRRELSQVKNQKQTEVADENGTDDKAAEDLSPTDKSEKEEQEDRTKFKDMTLQEKVNYFVSTPSHVPKMKCELQTRVKTYRGMIIDYKENEVFIRVGRKTSSVPFDQITGIRMLGF